ncbi:pre-rRNA 2'-O-ribose RNA methyltransferase FTSJ3 [Sceloporus undulatus]|uniref:pre-rRNA 2'-O-ribose RNA methyltransferase FTSJ3 n=1 Tax=Sceloporus undulatus TaxID=8520 RepID=UPI001C4AD238|nr:pre-rRNA 2'-O-ribose RNA methyltransferase FTSJ3 [Sceloporus undulatus]
MGKKGKVGKSRRDKFYHLAKETGFRSRSSFKLIQLNRKFQFLPKSRALLDLCAAPGGWLQVASKFMPVSSLIIGVDLVSIKPIPNVVTLQEDITTEKCRQALRKELKTWKVDVVLNDGAPNVGASWVHDAFSQANLTLSALKLACDFLSKGGWFITKVFRSRDYQPLLWIFQQLFRKVQATKPQASRNESAEIFVVCQGYLAPDKIDSKFFDPKFAFKEVEVQAKSVTELVSQKKPKAEGYEDGATILYKRCTLTDFLKASNPVDFLSKASEIVLDSEELEHHSATTEEVRHCCQDIRVLGRKELRALLNWRTKLRRFLVKKLKDQAKEIDINLSSGEEGEGEEETKPKRQDPEPHVREEDEAKEEEELELKLAELKAEEMADLKRKKRKILRERRRQRERVELKMDLPGVSVADDGDTGMFSLRAIGKSQLLHEVAEGNMAAADTFVATEANAEDDFSLSEGGDSDDDVSLASELDDEEMAEVEKRSNQMQRANVPENVASDEEEEENAEAGNPLLISLEGKEERDEHQTNLWFGKEVFAGIDDDADEALEIGQAQVLSQSQAEPPPDSKNVKRKKKLPQHEAAPELMATESLTTETTEAPSEEKVSDTKESESSESSDSDSDEEREQPNSRAGMKRLRTEPRDIEVIPIEDPVKRARVLDPEGLALGEVIATSRKAKRDLIDDSFNRYTFNEEEGELPDWFVQEEHQHRRKPLPLDRDTVEEYRQRWREINARPIKKVAEAKARKKRRMLKKLEQMKKKAESVVNTVDISEREKAAQLCSIYKKAGLGKEKRQVTYVVSKKGAGRKVRRPAGVKGHFKVVDSRLKKDMRAQKRKEQKPKRRRQK